MRVQVLQAENETFVLITNSSAQSQYDFSNYSEQCRIGGMRERRSPGMERRSPGTVPGLSGLVVFSYHKHTVSKA